ncbi:RNA-binding domain superfamily [Arabidopsis suecica]|uniref:RNA-binding domain superfamily n=1 Tax=Arabidopsis suecica TaxID=45249 RepID=A0A8T1XT20_ARASU|nr:RNA-binding domain superfamily [Arabidopsis suecica]
MEEFAIKGQESLETKDRERGSTISVEGYDTSVHEYPLELALRKHFASCGKIQRFHIFKDFKRVFLKSPLFISFWKEEEGAVDKALQLSGSDVGGWNVVVKAAPRPEGDCNPHVGNLCRRERDLLFSVYEIPSSLSEIDVKIGLCNLFSSCGEVTGVFIYAHIDNQCEAIISFVGKGCVDKAQELMSERSIRSTDGWNVALTKVFPPMPKSLRKPTGFLNPLFKDAKIDEGKQKMQKKTTETKKKQKKKTSE